MFKRLTVGVRVKTAKREVLKHNDDLFGLEVIRKGEVEGVITRYSDAHGLCYAVRHDDGDLGWYEPEELQVVVCDTPVCSRCGEVV